MLPLAGRLRSSIRAATCGTTTTGGSHRAAGDDHPRHLLAPAGDTVLGGAPCARVASTSARSVDVRACVDVRRCTPRPPPLRTARPRLAPPQPPPRSVVAPTAGRQSTMTDSRQIARSDLTVVAAAPGRASLYSRGRSKPLPSAKARRPESRSTAPCLAFSLWLASTLRSHLEQCAAGGRLEVAKRGPRALLRCRRVQEEPTCARPQRASVLATERPAEHAYQIVLGGRQANLQGESRP